MLKFDTFFNDYYFLLVWGFLSFFFLSILLVLALILSKKTITFEKVSAYECGFEPFESVTTFNIHYYIIGLSFLIFDLELVYLYPWALYWGILPLYSFFFVLAFLFIVILGFIYEWDCGLLSIV